MSGKIYDVTQEVFSCKVFGSNPAPKLTVIHSMDEGYHCNLSAFSMCAHNGTHVDAPYHFINEGKRIDDLGLEPFVGDCFVARHEGDVSAEDAKRILSRAEEAGCARRILIAGKATVTEEAARVFAEAGLLLLGNESQTFGPENAPAAVHRILLGAGMALLEGVVLTEVPEGSYLLNAAPINLGGREGAPCRAWLMER